MYIVARNRMGLFALSRKQLYAETCVVRLYSLVLPLF